VNPLTDLLGNLQLFMAVLIRTSGVILATPVINGREVPLPVKAGLVLVIAVLIFPTLPAAEFRPAHDLVGFAAMAAGELAVGLALSFVALLTFGTVQIAGEMISRQMDFDFAQIADPLFDEEASLLSQFNLLMAAVVLLAINGHHWFLQALHDSFARVPIGGFVWSGRLCAAAVDLFSSIYVLGVQLAAPLVCAFLLITVAVGVLARVAPQLNVLMIGIGLRVGAGLIGIGLFIPYLVAYIERLMLGMRRDLYLVIEAMRG